MPVPNAMSDLNQLPGSNYPVGSEAIGNNLDNYLRAHAALIRQSNAVASSSMPSGSTVNVSISDGESVTVTGDATINSLGPGFVGCKRELRFTGAATLVHSASLQLPQGRNVVTAAGHTHTFRCVASGAWALVNSALPPGFLNQWGAIDPATMQQALGFNPVQQGGGVEQLNNKVYIGWDGVGLRAQVDESDLGRLATQGFVNDGYLGKSGAQTLSGSLSVVTAGLYGISVGSRIRSSGTQAAINIQDRAGGAAPEWAIYSAGNVLRWNLDGSGDRATLSTAGLDVTGYIEATGDVGGLSDRRVKSEIRTIESPLSIVRQLRGTTYLKDGARKYGVIAQEVEEVMPEIVRDADDGLKRVACGNEIPAVLIEALKEIDGRMQKAGI